MEALRSVLAKLGFQIDSKELDAGNKKFNSFLSNIASGWASLRLGKGAWGFLEGQAKVGSDLQFLAAQLGFTTQELQKYKYAADQVGLSTQQFTTAMKIMQNHLGGTTTLTGMQHGIKVFGQFGVATRNASTGKLNDLPEMIGQVADKMQTMTEPARRARLAMEMFGEMGFRLVPLLMNGRKGVQALFQDFEKLNLSMYDDYIAASTLVVQRTKMMKTAFQVFKSELAFGAYPWFLKVQTSLAKMSSWMTGLSRRTTFATTIWVAFGAAMMYQIVRLAGGFRMLLMWMSRLAWPLLLAGLLYLVFDDLFALFTGKKSVIAGLLIDFMGYEAALKLTKDLKRAWDSVGEAMVAVKPALVSLLGSFGTLADELLPSVVEFFVFILQSLAAASEAFAGLIKGSVGFFKVWEELKEKNKGNKYATNGSIMTQAFADPRAFGQLDETWARMKDLWKAPPRQRRDLAAQGGGGGVQILNTVNVEGVVSNQEDMKKTVETAVKKANSMPVNRQAIRQVGFDPAGF